MTLSHRRLIYTTFIIVFLISAPILVLYTSGYRYNPKKKSVQKTGIIFLETKPKDVNIFLNDNFIDNQTPLQIKNLLPNQYHLKLEKENYFTWQKNINVFENLTTPLQYVRLFKQNTIPKILVNSPISLTTQSQNKSSIAYLTQADELNQVNIINLSGGSPTLVYSTKYNIEKLEFLNNDYLAIYFPTNILIVDLLNPADITDIKAKASIPSIQSVKLIDANYFYYLDAGDLYSYNLVEKKSRLIINSPSPIIDYYPQGNLIYYLNQESLNKTSLKQFSLSENSDKTMVLLGRSDSYKFEPSPSGFILINNILKHELVLLNQSTHNPETIQSADYNIWNNNFELLFGNNHELWSYSPELEQDPYILFTRTGEIISDAVWYPVDTHIFYIVTTDTGQKIKVTENLISNRYTADIIELDQIKNLFFSSKGDRLYFTGKIGNQQGLYELEIQ